MVSGTRPTITLAVCTFDRAESLALLLQELVRQSPPPASWELLVVNSGAFDAARACAEAFEERLPLHLLDEPRRGLSVARNRAVAEARGDFLLFTDDDVRLETDWLAAFARAFALHPHVAFFGGRVTPEWPGPLPRWFREETARQFAGVLGAYDRGAETRRLEPDEQLPIGGSLAFRRDVLASAEPFRNDLGVVGRDRGRGEETELLQRLRAAGYPGVYVGEASCRHPVRPDAFRLRHLYRYGIASGIAHQRMTGGNSKASAIGAPVFLAKGIYQLLKGRGDRFRHCVLMAGVEIGAARARRSVAPPSAKERPLP